MRWMVCRAAPWWTDACEDGGGGACVGLMLMVRAGGRGAVSLYASLFSFLFKAPKDFGMGWDMAVGIRTNWE